MGTGIKGKLIEATYRNSSLNGTFEDEVGNHYSIENAVVVPTKDGDNRRVFIFRKHETNEEQSYLDDICLSVTIINSNKSNSQLTGSDFINQIDSLLFLKDEEDKKADK